MFQTTVIASGSKGNCVFVRTDTTAILLDAGIAVKRIFASLEQLKINPLDIQAVILSHEHSDHSQSVGSVARTLKIPLFVTQDTLQQGREKLGKLYDYVRHFRPGITFELGDIIIHPFSSSHDAIDSCNFTFHKKGIADVKLGVATDLGYPSKLSTMHLNHCTTLILESNHDIQMLMEGPYEWFLKQRVKSIQGHLSNEQAVGVISQVMHPGLKTLILAHLSETNNTPALAEQTMRNYLQTIRSDIRLLVAHQHIHTPLFDI
ncbi:MAG: MBL fold metallo-hydrolase [Candidatus Cloacimonetes bacterium HGW-Cloacimonetes-1]|jgi:phosphoribosyl 1,2-cyclic phosphodiesterase|nr:MAG: MBL fold metallo-hydrolase [Candidatus Cloacimonetes bacterium HGW-Cloacimonetes-1]